MQCTVCGTSFVYIRLLQPASHFPSQRAAENAPSGNDKSIALSFETLEVRASNRVLSAVHSSRCVLVILSLARALCTRTKSGITSSVLRRRPHTLSSAPLIATQPPFTSNRLKVSAARRTEMERWPRAERKAFDRIRHQPLPHRVYVSFGLLLRFVSGREVSLSFIPLRN